MSGLKNENCLDYFRQSRNMDSFTKECKIDMTRRM